MSKYKNACRLIDILAGENGLVAVLEAYFDASRRDAAQQDNVLSVAGVVFGSDRAKKALRDWKKLWPDGFHMNKFNARVPPYDKLGDTEIHQKMLGMVEIIRERSEHVVAASCSLDELKRLAPEREEFDSNYHVLTDAMSTGYGLCLHMAMSNLGRLTENYKQGVSYFIEKGDLHQGRSAVFIDAALREKEYLRLYNYKNHAFDFKAENRMFEMADFLAWEWSKDRERMGRGESRRKSINALFEDKLAPIDVPFKIASQGYHFEGAPLKKMFDSLRVIYSKESA